MKQANMRFKLERAARAGPGSVVRSDLVLCGYRGEVWLPDDLTINGDLDLSSTRVVELPEGLSSRGSILLRGCTDLLRIMENVSSMRGINASGCVRLMEVPGSLEWGAGFPLVLDGCESIEHLRGFERCPGSLSLSGCTGLRELPEGLEVMGDLDLSGCTGLRGLPGRLRVHGTLCLSQRPDLIRHASSIDAARVWFGFDEPYGLRPSERLKVLHEEHMGHVLSLG